MLCFCLLCVSEFPIVFFPWKLFSSRNNQKWICIIQLDIIEDLVDAWVRLCGNYVMSFIFVSKEEKINKETNVDTRLVACGASFECRVSPIQTYRIGFN